MRLFTKLSELPWPVHWNHLKSDAVNHCKNSYAVTKKIMNHFKKLITYKQLNMTNKYATPTGMIWLMNSRQKLKPPIDRSQLFISVTLKLKIKFN